MYDILIIKVASFKVLVSIFWFLGNILVIFFLKFIKSNFCDFASTICPDLGVGLGWCFITHALLKL